MAYLTTQHKCLEDQLILYWNVVKGNDRGVFQDTIRHRPGGTEENYQKTP
jgi:hypothetical protein